MLTTAIPQDVTIAARIPTGHLMLVPRKTRQYKARMECLTQTMMNVYISSALKKLKKK